ncbi:MAG: hypothetical protein KDB14_29270 [Planctomycetales bacterium]|nr:hypothetical protein [Planctomycetales bacterium]
MRARHSGQSVLIGLICGSLCFADAPRVIDIRAGADGSVRGVVVNSAGLRQAQAVVRFSSNGKESARATANEQGQFQVALAPGLYQADLSGDRALIRVWNSQAAPPAAAPGLMVVQPGTTARGNRGAVFGVPELLLTAAAVGGVIVLATARHSSGS